jgi:pSer/pThr/pTyr-binding forkhead associated (FHA) protein
MLERTDSGEPRSVALGARTRIGRAADGDIVIDEAAVSRHHALIHLDRAGAVLEDLNSTNGTFLNGRRVLRAALRDGDVVTLGEARFRVIGPDGPSEP